MIDVLHVPVLAEFSRIHCLSICAVLVPLNILTSSALLMVTGLGQSRRVILSVAGMASVWAGLLLLHVLSWWVIGVIMAPTYILIGFASLCLTVQGWALIDSASLRWVLQRVIDQARQACEQFQSQLSIPLAKDL